MKRTVSGIAAWIVAAGTAANSATLRVPEDYPSVLAAVDAAVAGDSVLVGPGTWTQADTRVVNVNGQTLPITACAFLKPEITVIGVDGPASTVIQPVAGEGLVHVVPGVDSTSVEGLTVTADVAVVASQAAPLLVTNCWLLDNSIAAVDVATSGRIVFRSCVLEGNCWNSTGSWAIVSQTTQIELYDCEIRDNVGKYAMWVLGAPQVIMDGCVVSGHKNYGACVFEDVLDLQVRNSTFVDNKDVGSGAGVNTIDSFGVVEFCVFARDSAQDGGGMTMRRGSVRLSHNTFFACDAPLASAVLIDGPDPGFDNNIVAYSTGSDGAVARATGGNVPVTGCNIFWANQGGDFWSYGPWGPAPTDIFADPQFCDPLTEDLMLHSTSPGAPGVTPACGTIGALGVGCGPVSIEGTTWGRIKSQYR